MTPASTGAQQEEATPENRPREKKLALSPWVVSGARRNDMLHMRPVSEYAASASISAPPTRYSSKWYLLIVADTRLMPRVMGTSTTARPAANTKVSGSSRQRRFFVAT